MSQNYRFGVVSREVILSPDLSIKAKALYSVLACYANKQRSCFPSISTLADDLNVSQRTTKRLIKELKDQDYIKRVGRKLIIK
jgi:DNA-binding MarR family transcriptional regulator